MYKFVFWTMGAAGLVIGLSAAASAAPAMTLSPADAAPASVRLESVDYTWNHHQYHHRDWDRKNRRWNYHN
jgi:hypothetical protein